MNVDFRHMSRALELAARGQGRVEPNPMVGCVLARGEQTVAEGWHQQFGGPHAEVVALRQAGEGARGATMYVTLEPCSHHGKTPPCSEAVAQSGVERVVIAHQDPFAQVSGSGIGQLQQAGVEVDVGLLENEARALNAPYLKLIETGRPWLIAKWAMTLDGKIATATGDSRWISSEASRAVVHRLRGRVDGIMIGRKTAERDDPLLTARPPGPRVATRIVVDSLAALSPDSQLAKTAHDAPVLVAASSDAAQPSRKMLGEAGCEVYCCDASDRGERLEQLLDELGRRRMTNILVEGGGQLLGALFDRRAVDEVHVFVAPKLVGGDEAASAVGGGGIDEMSKAIGIVEPNVEVIGGDVYVRGRVGK